MSTKLERLPKVQLWGTVTALASGARRAADYSNASNLAIWCDLYWEGQFNTAAPAVGDRIADIYLLPGDGEATEGFPEGGDGTVGSDDNPQALFRKGTLESINPSITVDERLCVGGILLHGGTNRFVLQNTDDQTMDMTEVYIIPYRYTGP